MNIDKYNEAIKQKLESIEPDFQEQDWNEMLTFMALNTPKSNVLGRIILYSAGVVLLFSSLFFNFKQNNNNKILLKTNELLTQKNKVKNISDTKIIHQKDTVYLTKYITKWRTVERIVYVEKGDNPESFVGTQTMTDKKNQKESFFQAENNLKIVKISEDKSLIINALNNISSIQNSFVWNKNLPKINFISKIPIQENRKHITINLPSFVDVKYRVGVSLDLADEQTGGGILSEVLLNKHWGVNVGLRFLNITGKSYFTAEQFLFSTNQDFRQNFAPYVPSNFDIINIDFEHYLLQLPIGITYRYPLRKDFNLLFSATTDLDLYVRQHINFDYKQDNNNFEEGTYKSNNSKSFFNNIEFSAGLEKKYKRIIFQVNPFFSAQLKQVAYKKEAFVFGAKMRFLVNFGK